MQDELALSCHSYCRQYQPHSRPYDDAISNGFLFELVFIWPWSPRGHLVAVVSYYFVELVLLGSQNLYPTM